MKEIYTGKTRTIGTESGIISTEEVILKHQNNRRVQREIGYTSVSLDDEGKLIAHGKTGNALAKEIARSVRS